MSSTIQMKDRYVFKLYDSIITEKFVLINVVCIAVTGAWVEYYRDIYSIFELIGTFWKKEGIETGPSL